MDYSYQENNKKSNQVENKATNMKNKKSKKSGTNAQGCKNQPTSEK